MLKVQSDTSGRVKSAWDLNWDPDQTRDLLKEDSGYLGQIHSTFPLDPGELYSLADKMFYCLEDYWFLLPPPAANRWVPPSSWREPTNSTQCPPTWQP
jgi:hypothetical protein